MKNECRSQREILQQSFFVKDKEIVLRWDTLFVKSDKEVKKDAPLFVKGYMQIKSFWEVQSPCKILKQKWEKYYRSVLQKWEI